jgi:formylglycine-generating enzyme required for sulfatase activity
LGILKDKLGKTKLAFSEEIGQDALLHKINNFFEAEGGKKIEAGVKNRLNNASYELSRFWKLTNCEVRRVIEAAKQIDETTQIKRVWLTLRFIIYSKNLLTRIISHALNHFPQKELTKEKESPEKLAEKLSEKILKRIYLINWDFSWKKPRDLKEGFGIDLGEGAEIEMVLIPGGSFLMGSPESEGYKNERSQHPVKVSQFFMSKYLITQEQYEAVMGNNPSKFKGANRPVECVSWDNANTFCKKISDLCSNFYSPEQTFRLPSEAEWEYACRAGTTTPFYFGESITTKCVNYGDSYICGVRAEDVNFRRGTRDVGSLPCNGFWLYDMHGNVYEWCQDVWHENYNGAPTDGIAWESNGNSSRRVVRGGFWGSHPRYCRSAHRNYMYVGNRKYKYKCSTIGFRVVVTENPQSKFSRSKHSIIRYYG